MRLSSMRTEEFGGSVVDTVVANGLCVGCGMCAGMLPDVLRMRVDKYGAYLPEIIQGEPEPGWQALTLRLCPFGDRDQNEDTIAAELFAHQDGIQHRSETGYFLECFAGHVMNKRQRLDSTSGGLITWLVQDMLATGAVDAAVCVGRSDTPDSLFKYQIIRSPQDLERCRKSRYYPVEVSEVIPRIRASQDKVVVVGLPCFLKALRYAMMEDEVLKQRVVCTIGLFCGHLKTRHYAAYLARCCGVAQDQIVTVDFRKKVAGRPAGRYAFEVLAKEQGGQVVRHVSMSDVFGGNWSFNLFMLSACDCCDDVMAETADISIGDAWLPEYTPDWRGTSMIICRSRAFFDRLRRGVDSGQLHLEPVAVSKAIRSQAGALRHRRGGLAYRLYLAKKRDQWRPRKRVCPDGSALPLFRRIIQRIRMRMQRLSGEAFLVQQKREGIHTFVNALRPWVWLHFWLYRARRLLWRVKKRAGKLFG